MTRIDHENRNRYDAVWGTGPRSDAIDFGTPRPTPAGADPVSMVCGPLSYATLLRRLGDTAPGETLHVSAYGGTTHRTFRVVRPGAPVWWVEPLADVHPDAERLVKNLVATEDGIMIAWSVTRRDLLKRLAACAGLDVASASWWSVGVHHRGRKAADRLTSRPVTLIVGGVA